MTHAATMVVQSFSDAHERIHVPLGVALFGTVGLLLLVVATKQAPAGTAGKIAVPTP